MADKFEEISKKDIKDAITEDLINLVKEELRNVDTTIKCDADETNTFEETK